MFFSIYEADWLGRCLGLWVRRFRSDHLSLIARCADATPILSRLEWHAELGVKTAVGEDRSRTLSLAVGWRRWRAMARS